ncbi:MAG: XamI family restriction endonuclease [Dehalococcoidia bacterium]|nr:XamI family restriction endonuclease [Dehalococcoidia bacterium]
MTTIGDKETAEHDRQIAAELFRSGLTPVSSRAAWESAVDQSRLQVLATLEATSNLHDAESALLTSARHMEVLRCLMAPPVSQDRLAIICRDYSKDAEKSGRPCSPEVARQLAEVFARWQDTRRTDPIRDQLAGHRGVAVEITAGLMGQRWVATSIRGASSARQEQDVLHALRGIGLQEQSRKPLLTSRDLNKGELLHKARMANVGGLSQEVDVAVGLDRGVILALECKVSNDETNSIKRANDVLNKARAWQSHWGNFVVTGALLQGVFGPNDVVKLLDANVVVFWHHQLAKFLEWVQSRT